MIISPDSPRPWIKILSVFSLGLILAAAPASASDLLNSRPLKVFQTVEARFPEKLLAEGVREGVVHAVLNVDADGKLADCLVTAYTHLPLAQELLSVMRDWEFEPAWQRGEPTGTRVAMKFSFQARGAVLSLTPLDIVSAQFRQVMGLQPTVLVCHASELDAPLAVLHQAKPRHPGSALSPSQATGTASIDFYIDGEGRPRMPVVLRASHEAFAAAAAEALTQWRFAPPTRNGQPMAVRVVQEFIFAAERS